MTDQSLLLCPKKRNSRLATPSTKQASLCSNQQANTFHSPTSQRNKTSWTNSRSTNPSQPSQSFSPISSFKMIDFILIILITHSIIFYIPMNVLRSNYVFPSYSKIKQDIINKKSKAYDGTIRRLNKKLVEMSQ